MKIDACGRGRPEIAPARSVADGLCGDCERLPARRSMEPRPKLAWTDDVERSQNPRRLAEILRADATERDQRGVGEFLGMDDEPRLITYDDLLSRAKRSPQFL